MLKKSLLKFFFRAGGLAYLLKLVFLFLPWTVKLIRFRVSLEKVMIHVLTSKQNIKQQSARFDDGSRVWSF